jgi:hypothetical protein
MNNLRKLSIILLLSLGMASESFAKSGCNDTCATTSSDCNTCDTNSSDCNTCDTGSSDCNSNNKCCNSTVLIPRSITTNLTLRNNLTFFNKYHEARCNLFTWDNTFVYQQNRRGRDLAAGFFGTNPLVVAETGGNINSLFLGLGAAEGFSSTLCLKPRREVFAWLPQFWFNLDCCCTGLWADVSFAVEHVRNKLHFSEEVTNAGTITGEPTSVAQFFANNNVLSDKCRHTGVDEVLLRFGYDWNFCANDHFGFYFLGLIPTGKRVDNTRFFQPIVGSKHGAIGAGLEGDYTLYTDECNNSDLVFQTELMYLYRLKHKENRVFDLNNGPLSRFLLATTAANPFDCTSLLSALTQCVKVEPRHQVEWWLNLHYQICNWGLEGSYNLFWKDREHVKCPTFNFGGLGLLNLACGGNTTNSTATIDQAFGAGTPDATFTPLTTANVNLRSGLACKQLSHTFSGAVSYNNVWSDCYPFLLGLGGSFEVVSKKYRRSTFENWNVYAKFDVSF